MISLQNISKRYIISHEKEALVRNMFSSFLRISNYREFWALRDINLELDSDICLGVIGRNGSGKTTLLSVISGITTPTNGRVSVTGRVSTLLTLEAGLHPELTGLENIYLNGAILGMTINQIRNRLTAIIGFAELSDFIDVPLRTYSAGMKMRLGFAVAINADFDILLVDEVFSVGDISFQQKCLNKMKDIRNQGKIIVLVSQSLGLIKEFCDEAILMDNGRILDRGSPVNLANEYQEMMGVKAKKAEGSDEPIVENTINHSGDRCKDVDSQLKFKEVNVGSSMNKCPLIINLSQSGQGIKTGAKEAQIIRVRFLDSRNIEKKVFETGENMRIVVDYIVKKEIPDPHFGIAIFRDNGIYCFGPNTRLDGIKIERLKKGEGQFSIEYKSLNLLPGRYLVSIVIWERDEKFAYDNHYAYYSLEVESEKKDHGVCFLEHKWKLNLPK
jgi:ABC-type polysaccharide/polyol phosphate transport system ATPase subunit